MPDMGKKVCLNHTDIQATSRCTTCFKPLCDECIIRDNEEDFCCQICVEKHKRTSENIALLNSRPKSNFMGRLITWIIIIALAYGAWKYQDKIKELFNGKDKKEIKK